MKAATVWMMAVFVLAGCAGNGTVGDRERISEIYRNHSGSPESYVRYTSIRGWQSAGYDGIVLELNGHRHYFVELSGPCDYDLHSAPTLRLVTVQHNRLSTFDKVFVREQYCDVTGIYRIDMDAVEADLARLREEGAGTANGEVEIEVEEPPDTAA